MECYRSAPHPCPCPLCHQYSTLLSSFIIIYAGEQVLIDMPEITCLMMNEQPLQVIYRYCHASLGLQNIYLMKCMGLSELQLISTALKFLVPSSLWSSNHFCCNIMGRKYHRNIFFHSKELYAIQWFSICFKVTWHVIVFHECHFI